MDLQLEGGTCIRIKYQDMPPTIEKILIEPKGMRLVDIMLEAPAQLTLKMIIQCIPSLGRDLMAWLMGNEECASLVTKCDYVEEDVDLHNILISWEGETSNVTLPLSNKDSPIIHAIVDGSSGVNIISCETYDKWGLPPLEKSPYTIKLADQSRVTPLGLARDVHVRLAGVRFLMSFVVMEFPRHSSSFLAFLGRPWLRAAVALHD